MCAMDVYNWYKSNSSHQQAGKKGELVTQWLQLEFVLLISCVSEVYIYFSI